MYPESFNELFMLLFYLLCFAQNKGLSVPQDPAVKASLKVHFRTSVLKPVSCYFLSL